MLEAVFGPSRIKDAIGILILVVTALLWATDVTRGSQSATCDCADGEVVVEVSLEVAPVPEPGLRL